MWPFQRQFSWHSYFLDKSIIIENINILNHIQVHVWIDNTQTIIVAPSYPFASVGEPSFCIYGELFTRESWFKKYFNFHKFENGVSYIEIFLHVDI